MLLCALVLILQVANVCATCMYMLIWCLAYLCTYLLTILLLLLMYEGHACGSHAHMTGLVRLKQGPFCLDDCLHEEDWTPEHIEAHILQCNKAVERMREEEEGEEMKQ